MRQLFASLSPSPAAFWLGQTLDLLLLLRCVRRWMLEMAIWSLAVEAISAVDVYKTPSRMFERALRLGAFDSKLAVLDLVGLAQVRRMLCRALLLFLPQSFCSFTTTDGALCLGFITSSLTCHVSYVYLHAFRRRSLWLLPALAALLSLFCCQLRWTRLALLKIHALHADKRTTYARVVPKRFGQRVERKFSGQSDCL